VEINERDHKIGELKDNLDKAHVMITYLQQENRELRHKVSKETIQPREEEPLKETMEHVDKGK